VPALRRYSLPDDGLLLPWEGRVWLNPPYGSATGAWVRRLAAHGDGIALVFARTDTAWFHDTAPSATVVCFVRGRLSFVPGDEQQDAGTAGAASMLLAFGRECGKAVTRSGLGLCFGGGARPLMGQASLFESG
jgi:hypothetical protein